MKKLLQNKHEISVKDFGHWETSKSLIIGL